MSDIELDIDDYKRLLDYKGEIFGCVKQISKENFEMEIIEKCRKYFNNGKAVTVEFEIDKGVSLFEINDYMYRINNVCSEDISLIFGCRENKHNNDSPIIIRILISGLETKKY